MRMTLALLAVVLLATSASGANDPVDVWDRVEHHWAENDGVKLHYVTLGEGPVLLFVHGFPDFWYTWRHQMNGLSDDFQCVAMDTRGYNRSDQPRGVENYAAEHLLADVSAVIADLGVAKVTLVGHDWGGYIAWRYAMEHPESVERLIILNLTHPRGYLNVMAAASEDQRRNTEYARRFASSEPDDNRSAVVFAGVGAAGGPVVAARYREAMERSYYDGMLNYYRANYGQVSQDVVVDLPDITCPVLQFHGLLDTAVDKDGLAHTWDWIDADYTLVTLPDVDHWVQRGGAEVVTSTIRWWLRDRR